MNSFKDKTLLITGGTGSLAMLCWSFCEIRSERDKVFSRDEKKQDEMRHEINEKKVNFIIVMSILTASTMR